LLTQQQANICSETAKEYIERDDVIGVVLVCVKRHGHELSMFLALPIFQHLCPMTQLRPCSDAKDWQNFLYLAYFSDFDWQVLHLIIIW